jgi:hypothetical protein
MMISDYLHVRVQQSTPSHFLICLEAKLCFSIFNVNKYMADIEVSPEAYREATKMLELLLQELSEERGKCKQLRQQVSATANENEMLKREFERMSSTQTAQVELLMLSLIDVMQHPDRAG